MELIEYSVASKWQSPVIRFQIWYILIHIIGTFLFNLATYKPLDTEIAKITMYKSTLPLKKWEKAEFYNLWILLLLLLKTVNICGKNQIDDIRSVMASLHDTQKTWPAWTVAFTSMHPISI